MLRASLGEKCSYRTAHSIRHSISWVSRKAGSDWLNQNPSGTITTSGFVDKFFVFVFNIRQNTDVAVMFYGEVLSSVLLDVDCLPIRQRFRGGGPGLDQRPNRRRRQARHAKCRVATEERNYTHEVS